MGIMNRCLEKIASDDAVRLIAELAGVDYRTACYALHETIEELQKLDLPAGIDVEIQAYGAGE